ncbi:proline iminopeptidase-family hydrolase [Terriglobus saanensis]|uniref:Proline-specific peptidase n=1 Tax=Terriglobus saanensis (strain ATCC BAA-1853 / DSM 23119 / SP1PR4) TaxID=401053 RepID=E8V036_TERSS|nr:proline iminopeptidase-family hydrolase [Terriglobus saanensis]ADV82191.1 proline-specific peptidase [Terriglobus saanensis SP1PR4]
MNRRKFLAASAASWMINTAGATASTVSAAEVTVQEPDGLNPPGIRTGGVRMVPVMGGKYKVWTKKVGSGPIKVLLLHGGPGFSHEYLEAMESFLPEAGIEMYYYDQLGCNHSDHPEDTWLWTLGRYVHEVEEVRQGLGLDHFVLYGHSFGGALALEYALKYPQNLRGLVVSNRSASSDAFLRHATTWKAKLSPVALEKLDALEAIRDYDSPEYEKIVLEDLYSQMICRSRPWPNGLVRSFEHTNQTIYTQMQGKNEFVATGNLKDWDVWGRLHEIQTKTLMIGSKYDEMDPKDMEKMATLVQHGTYAYCPNGSHLCMWDDQEVYFQKLLAFLRTV